MKKLKIAHWVLATIILLSCLQCTNNHKRLHKELTKRAVELNQSAPIALDEHTRFDGVEVSADNVFQYYYTITNIDNPHELIASQKKEMMEKIDGMYATDKSLQFFVKHRITIKYIYKDTMQNVVETITIKTDKYRRSKQQH